MTPFGINYRNFERIPQIQQLSTTVTPIIEEVFKNIETEKIDMTSSHSIIVPIVNQNLGNTLQHQNGPNQRQHTHIKKYRNDIIIRYS